MVLPGWKLAMIDAAGYNGIRKEHIEKVAQSILASHETEIDRKAFERHCRMCHIDPYNFTKEDIDALNDYLRKAS